MCGFDQSETAYGLCVGVRDIVNVYVNPHTMVNLYRGSIFVRKRRHYLPSKLKIPNNKTVYCLHVDATMRSLKKSYFHVSCRRRMTGTLTRQQPRTGDACQCDKMATVAPTFVTSTTFVTTHQFCQFISTVFVNFTNFVNSELMQSSPVLSTISTTYVATDEVTTFVNKARPLL